MRAIVTGASKGVGRGIAEALGEAGAVVYATGRDRAGLDATAASAEALGGTCIAVPCDHRDDRSTEALFERVLDEQGGLDLLVNNAWAGYEWMFRSGEYTWERPFWEQPLDLWDAVFAGGVRIAYAAARLAAPPMAKQGRGLIVNVSFWSAQKYIANVAYGVSKLATDRLTADAAHELRPRGVACVSLYPGLVRTERVMQAAEFLDLGNSESRRFVGRAVAALAADPEVMRWTGRVLIAASLAREYGFRDVDGALPRPLALEEA